MVSHLHHGKKDVVPPAWDVTVTDTVAAPYLRATSACAGWAAEAAAKRKENKYAEISHNYHLFTPAFETFDPIE